MTSTIRVFMMLALALGGGALHAQTVTRHLSINPYGTDISQGGSAGPGATYSIGYSGARGGGLAAIQMPDPTGGISKLSFGFTVPDDYAPGTIIYLRVLWRSEAISCVVDLRNNNLIWSSPGATNQNGAVIRETQMIAPNDNRYTSTTRFKFNFVPQPPIQPGDSFNVGMYRSSLLDSCAGTLFIQGLSIEYQALAVNVFADGFETIS